MRQTELRLTEEDRLSVDMFRSRGVRHAREVNRAHILSCLDRGIPESQIMSVLGVGRTAIWRTRAAYLEGGLEYALHDAERTGKPTEYDTDAEAKVAALACSAPPAGAKRWTLTMLERAAQREIGPISRESIRRLLKKNCIKPWRKLMWCIGVLTEQYRERMYNLLELYAQPFRAEELVICLDEKSKQLTGETRQVLPMKPGTPAKHDYEYARAGTCNLFVAVEPKGGRRTVAITEHRGKLDFVLFVQHLVEDVYAKARRIHLVMDNLNTHFRKCFDEVLGKKSASTLLRRVVFHYTPKHASWLNMAEIEIGILTANAWIDDCQRAPFSKLKLMHGSDNATPKDGASFGGLLDKTQMKKWPGIMFRN